MRRAVLLSFFSCSAISSISTAGQNPELPAAITNSTPAITNRLSWLDALHAQDEERITKSVNRVDGMFAEKATAIHPLTNSTFRFRPEVEIRDLDNPEVKARLNVQANLNMPNIENRLHLFVNNLAPDKLPDESPFAQNNDIYVGLRRIADIKSIPSLDTRIGARWHGGPVAFGRAELSHCFTIDQWNIYPSQSAFWFSDDGLGEKTAIVIEHCADNTLVQSTSAGVYSETSNGLEWEQSILLDHIFAGTRDSRIKAVSTQFSSFGHSDDRSIIDAYRWDILSFRTPVYREWLFFEITPSLEWANENNWDPVWSVTISFDDFLQ